MARRAQQKLGKALRKLRRDRSLTLVEVSKGTGISPGFLSLVENDKTDLTMGRLASLADFYGVDMRSLVGPAHSSSAVIMAKHTEPRATVRSESEGVEFTLLHTDSDRAMFPALVTLQSGGTWAEPSAHHGEEILYILQGKLEAEVDNRLYVLKAGDLISFPAILPHRIKNVDVDVVRILSVSTTQNKLVRDSLRGKKASGLKQRRKGVLSREMPLSTENAASS
jgi:quercetin dioxygenase-like cupin family protein